MHLEHGRVLLELWLRTDFLQSRNLRRAAAAAPAATAIAIRFQLLLQALNLVLQLLLLRFGLGKCLCHRSLLLALHLPPDLRSHILPLHMQFPLHFLPHAPLHLPHHH